MTLIKFGGTTKEQDELAKLVTSGDKVATSSLVSLQRIHHLPTTKVGDIWGIIDGEDRAVCTVKITHVSQRRWVDIDEEFAKDEGDGTLAMWRGIHEPYYRAQLKQYHLTLLPSTLLECVYFEKID